MRNQRRSRERFLHRRLVLHYKFRKMSRSALHSIPRRDVKKHVGRIEDLIQELLRLSITFHGTTRHQCRFHCQARLQDTRYDYRRFPHCLSTKWHSFPRPRELLFTRSFLRALLRTSRRTPNLIRPETRLKAFHLCISDGEGLQRVLGARIIAGGI
jgi:hypothetical protein